MMFGSRKEEFGGFFDGSLCLPVRYALTYIVSI